MKTNSLVYTDKAKARAELSQIRKNIGNIKSYSDSLRSGIATLDDYKNADILLLYSPTQSEPDLTLLAQKAWEDEKKVAFPISQTGSLTLDFRIVRNLGELCVGAYGILEPSKACAIAEFTQNSLCVVPALAVDCDGYRLGYGKGYYDRFLASFAGRSIVALHSSLVCERLPRLDTDIPIKTIITETGAIRLK